MLRIVNNTLTIIFKRFNLNHEQIFLLNIYIIIVILEYS